MLALVKSPFVRLYAPDHAPERGRNFFLGDVTARVDAERNSEIHIDIGHGKTLHVVAPRETVEDLGLEPGAKVAACFDASQVILAVN